MAIHDAFVVKYEVSSEAEAEKEEEEAPPVSPYQTVEQRDAGETLMGKEKGRVKGRPRTRGQTYLPLHCDQSSHSFTISLNDAGEYQGGGTYFPTLGTVVRPGKISFVCIQCIDIPLVTVNVSRICTL